MIICQLCCAATLQCFLVLDVSILMQCHAVQHGVSGACLAIRLCFSCSKWASMNATSSVRKHLQHVLPSKHAQTADKRSQRQVERMDVLRRKVWPLTEHLADLHSTKRMSSDLCADSTASPRCQQDIIMGLDEVTEHAS